MCFRQRIQDKKRAIFAIRRQKRSAFGQIARAAGPQPRSQPTQTEEAAARGDDLPVSLAPARPSAALRDPAWPGRVVGLLLVGFVIAGALAGLAGALMANQSAFVSPKLMHWVQSGTLMVMVILGGVGHRLGGLLGAAVLLGLEEAASGYTIHWQLLVGAVLLAVVLLAPRGIAGAFTREPRS